LSREKIQSLISKVSVASEVPADGDCGAHAVSFSLNQFGINFSTLEVLNLLSIPKYKTGYQLFDKDISAICDLFNKNLIIIHENTDRQNVEQNIGIVYYKFK